MNRDIRDFFHINLDSLPHTDFIQTSHDINEEGKQVITFHKTLKSPVFSLFQTIEVQQFDEGNKNIFFRNHELQKINLRDLKILVNRLFWFYGKDSRDRGPFTIKDRLQFQSSSNAVLFGRSWSAGNVIITPVDLFINREKNMLSMNIWNIKTEPVPDGRGCGNKNRVKKTEDTDI